MRMQLEYGPPVISVDLIVMLLSCEWFWPIKANTGMSLDESAGECIKIGCKKLVQKYFLERAESYNEIEFTNKRLLETYSDFKAVLDGCKLPSQDRDNIIVLGLLSHEIRTDLFKMGRFLSRLSTMYTNIGDNALSYTEAKSIENLNTVYLRARVSNSYENNSLSDWDKKLEKFSDGPPEMLFSYYMSLFLAHDVRRILSAIVLTKGSDQGRNLVTRMCEIINVGNTTREYLHNI